MGSLKVRSLLALTTHRSDHVNYLSGLDSMVSLVIYMGLPLELDKILSLTLRFHHIDWNVWLKLLNCLKTI